eukprot:NODE_5420_length_578_cov_88.175803_g4702_i0.p1 GENE.NODE_5420_length_578_cov_88.175803_g4702_i0~~NODE_5420_length_578_cov_88.175803_g4702_i0.p1  ORF type:complete len:84 (-),score=17.93 NODE_5420_length_578_cov_88.175803_g4702_i0:127-378(-)
MHSRSEARMKQLGNYALNSQEKMVPSARSSRETNRSSVASLSDSDAKDFGHKWARYYARSTHGLSQEEFDALYTKQEDELCAR